MRFGRRLHFWKMCINFLALYDFALQCLCRYYFLTLHCLNFMKGACRYASRDRQPYYYFRAPEALWRWRVVVETKINDSKPRNVGKDLLRCADAMTRRTPARKAFCCISGRGPRTLHRLLRAILEVLSAKKKHRSYIHMHNRDFWPKGSEMCASLPLCFSRSNFVN